MEILRELFVTVVPGLPTEAPGLTDGSSFLGNAPIALWSLEPLVLGMWGFTDTSCFSKLNGN